MQKVIIQLKNKAAGTLECPTYSAVLHCWVIHVSSTNGSSLTISEFDKIWTRRWSTIQMKWNHAKF